MKSMKTAIKSETMPKYHARETAEELARLHGASVFFRLRNPFPGQLLPGQAGALQAVYPE